MIAPETGLRVALLREPRPRRRLARLALWVDRQLVGLGGRLRAWAWRE